LVEPKTRFRARCQAAEAALLAAVGLRWPRPRFLSKLSLSTLLLPTGSPYIMKSDDFEWDDSKAAINLRNHKITFEMARDVFSDPFIVEWIDEGQDKSEERFAALGMANNRILFVAYTMRGDVIRIISARLAEPFERRKYYNENQA
jgi:uncharacterized DUF497 family protein